MERQAINPDTLAPGFGYSQLVSVSGGRTLYVAGQVAIDERGELVGAGDFAAQARQVFRNLRRALAAGGATPADIVKLGIFIVDHDLDRLALVREIRDEVLGVEESPPASTLLGVQALAMPEFMVEVDAIAVVA